MARPIARTDGMCFAFPDVLQTPAPPGPPVPLPYPNIAQLADAEGAAEDVNAGGKPVVLADSTVPRSTGGEPGTGGGVVAPGKHLGACTFTSASRTVTANGKGVVRQGDTTEQNDGNATGTGTVLVGLPTVLVGD